MTEQPKPARPKKKQKNQNAVKHGAFSREPMLLGEKRRDYEALRADLYASGNPTAQPNGDWLIGALNRFGEDSVSTSI